MRSKSDLLTLAFDIGGYLGRIGLLEIRVHLFLEGLLQSRSNQGFVTLFWSRCLTCALSFVTFISNVFVCLMGIVDVCIWHSCSRHLLVAHRVHVREVHGATQPLGVSHSDNSRVSHSHNVCESVIRDSSSGNTLCSESVRRSIRRRARQQRHIRVSAQTTTTLHQSVQPVCVLPPPVLPPPVISIYIPPPHTP